MTILNTKEKIAFYNAQTGSPLQKAIKDNEPLQEQIIEMIDACKAMVKKDIVEKIQKMKINTTNKSNVHNKQIDDIVNLITQSDRDK